MKLLLIYDYHEQEKVHNYKRLHLKYISNVNEGINNKFEFNGLLITN